MLKILKFIKGSFQEGVQEAKDEIEEEKKAKQVEIERSLEMIQTLSKNEIFGSALAAPFRTGISSEWFTIFKNDRESLSEDILPLYLFTFGDTLELTEEQLKNIEKQQRISFNVNDKKDVLSISKTFLLSIGLNLNSLADYDVLEDWNPVIFKRELDAVLLSATAVNLINAVDLKLLSKEEVLDIFDEIFSYVIIAYSGWEAFAEDFLAQEAILGWNKGIARKQLENEVNYLTYKWGSPWVRFPLEQLT